MNWEKELALAISAAKEAKKILLDFQQSKIQVLSQSGRDIKLEADIETEKHIKARLAESGYPILAEESKNEPDLPKSPYWIVDPLDGTLNFSRDIPFSCISIGLWQGQHPLLGVVYAVFQDELFSGIVGERAWLNGEQIKVSSINEKNKAILATGFPVYRDFGDESLKSFLVNVKAFKKIRLFGAAALSLAFLACGRVDAYSEEDIALWDVAGGIPLVLAAGGKVEYIPSKTKPFAYFVKASAQTFITK